MVAAGKCRLQESCDARLSGGEVDQTGAESDDVGIVMLAAEGCGEGFVDQCTAARRTTIDCDGDANARAAQRDATLAPAASDILSEFITLIGLVDAGAALKAQSATSIGRGTPSFWNHKPFPTRPITRTRR